MMGCILKTIGEFLLFTAGASMVYLLIRYADWQRLRETIDPIVNSWYFLWMFGSILFIGFVLSVVGDEMNKPK